MIDLLIVRGAVGAAKPYHKDRLANVTYARFSVSKTKPTITYMNSPLTGAQIDIQYWIEAIAGVPVAFVEIKLPLASATIGQNYIHAGLNSIKHEVKCAAGLIRIILVALGFHTDEVEHFMKTTEVTLCELTWHTATASRKALRSLQQRTENMFEALKEASGRHDVNIKDVDYRRRNGIPGLFVTLKNGDEYRQYGKFDQVSARTNTGKRRYALSQDLAQHRTKILAEIDTHVRNEVRLGSTTLKGLGLLHPNSWNPSSLKRAIDTVWKDAGFKGVSTSPRIGIPVALSPEAQATKDRYTAGELTKEDLPPYTFTRHRKAILRAGGPDIAFSFSRNRVKPEAVGYQLQYDRRWIPKGDLRSLILCEDTAPQIIEELQQGLEFLEFGVIPDIADYATRESWLKRWQHFAEREGVRTANH